MQTTTLVENKNYDDPTPRFTTKGLQRPLKLTLEVSSFKIKCEVKCMVINQFDEAFYDVKFRP